MKFSRRGGVVHSVAARSFVADTLWSGDAGDVLAAARALNIGRSTLYRRIQTLGAGDAEPDNDPLVAANVPVSLEAYEKAALLKAIELGRGDKRAAATALGISKSAIYRRLRSHGVE